jgi:hypothetical protein
MEGEAMSDHQKWEYHLESQGDRPRLTPSQVLADLGDKGWQLVAVGEGGMIFMRPKIEEKAKSIGFAPTLGGDR